MDQIHGGSFFGCIAWTDESMGLTIALRRGWATLKAGQVHTADCQWAEEQFSSMRLAMSGPGCREPMYGDGNCHL